MTTATKRLRLRSAQQARRQSMFRRLLLLVEGQMMVNRMGRFDNRQAREADPYSDTPHYLFSIAGFVIVASRAETLEWLDGSDERGYDFGLKDQIRAVKHRYFAPAISAWFAQRAAHDLLKEMDG